MLRSGHTKEREELRRHLGCWRELVERYARGLRGDPQQYAVLHGDLLERCRTLASGPAEEQKNIYKNAERLLQPWLNVEALKQAPQGILIEVLQRCRQAERALGGRSWLGAGRRWGRRILKTLAGAIALGVLVWVVVRWWLPLRSIAMTWRYEIRTALDRVGFAERWMIAGAIGVVIAMFVLSRTAKS